MLSAVRFPREGVRLSDFRLAWYLEMYSLLTASHIKVGDFSTPLRCARNDRRGATDWKGRFEERGLGFERALERNQKIPHEM